MAKIKEINAREILNAKGNPTVEVKVTLSDESSAVASCPSGTSLSSYEAHEIHDGELSRFRGLGVLKAVNVVRNVIAPKLIGMDANKQPEIDHVMLDLDGTQNKGRLGTNATLPVSIAVAKTAAISSKLPLYLYLRSFIDHKNTILKIPTPLFNILNGGLHAPGGIDFQECIISPATFKTYEEALQLGTNIYFALKDIVKINGYPVLVGDEGGFSPPIKSNYNALAMIQQAIDTTTYRLGYDVFLGLDAAANSFHNRNEYLLKDKQSPLSSKELTAYYHDLVSAFHLLYLEDILAEDDWEGWMHANSILSSECTIAGDDLIATNPYRLQTAIDNKAMTGVIIKPNQIGTVIEALAVVEMAREAGIKTIVSHRSGDTNDDFIADFGVAVSADYVKFGAPQRGERIAKYNRLSQIDEQLKKL